MTKPSSTPPLTKVETRIIFQGHPNNLTQTQQETLIEFKQRLIQEGYYHTNTITSQESTTTTTSSHEDADLLRFLRARKFDLEGAIVQFKATEDWRREEDVVQVYNTFPVEEFKEAQSVYPQWTGRYDNHGIPVYIFKVGSLSKESTNAYAAAEDRINPRTIALYELMNQFVVPFANSLPRIHEDIPIVATSTIVDISGVSLSRFWSLRSHMSRVSELASAHYPETLGSIYIIGAPSFFSVVWGWIGKWFDKSTVEKIFILSPSTSLQVLSSCMPLSSIPISYGGTLPFTYGETKPILNTISKEKLGLDEIPRGSIRWNVEKEELELLGSGRSQEEIERLTPRKKSSETSKVEVEVDEEKKEEVVSEEEVSSSSEESSLPSPITISPPPFLAETEVVVLVGDEEKHDIWTTAREEPAAPVKQLAEILNGTSL